MAEAETKPQFLSLEHQQAVIQALSSRGANQPCPRCLNPNFTLVDGYLNPVLHQNVKSVQLSGVSIPVVVVACTRCGWLAMHALGILGLMDQARQESEP